MPWTNIQEQIATPAQKRAYNAGLFSRIAREYDRATRAMSLGRDQAWKRRLVAGLLEHPAARCLDLACGTGDVTAALRARYPNGEVSGIDLTPEMIALAQERHQGLGLRFEVGDMCRTNVPDGWADVVTGSYALRNAPVLDQALAEVRRVLRPGGEAAFLDFAKSPSRFAQGWQLPLLKLWGGFWGVLLHGGPEHAYIAESLRQFPDRIELRRSFARHGFRLRSARNCFGGLLEIVWLVRE